MSFTKLLTVSALVSSTSAWWGDGHMLVARIAQSILENQNPASLKSTEAILSVLKKSDPSWTTAEGNHPFVDAQASQMTSNTREAHTNLDGTLLTSHTSTRAARSQITILPLTPTTLLKPSRQSLTCSSKTVAGIPPTSTIRLLHTV